MVLKMASRVSLKRLASQGELHSSIHEGGYAIVAQRTLEKSSKFSRVLQRSLLFLNVTDELITTQALQGEAEGAGVGGVGGAGEGIK